MKKLGFIFSAVLIFFLNLDIKACDDTLKNFYNAFKIDISSETATELISAHGADYVEDFLHEIYSPKFQKLFPGLLEDLSIDKKALKKIYKVLDERREKNIAPEDLMSNLFYSLAPLMQKEKELHPFLVEFSSFFKLSFTSFVEAYAKEKGRHVKRKSKAAKDTSIQFFNLLKQRPYDRIDFINALALENIQAAKNLSSLLLYLYKQDSSSKKVLTRLGANAQILEDLVNLSTEKQGSFKQIIISYADLVFKLKLMTRTRYPWSTAFNVYFRTFSNYLRFSLEKK